MNLKKLSYEESIANNGATHVAELTHADLTEASADTAQTIALLTVADKMSVECTHTVLKTAFQDASDAAFDTTAITVGDGNDVDELLTSQELNVNGTEVNQKTGTGVTHDYAAADTVDVVFGSMSPKALNDIDAGEVDIYLRVLDNR